MSGRLRARGRNRIAGVSVGTVSGALALSVAALAGAGEQRSAGPPAVFVHEIRAGEPAAREALEVAVSEVGEQLRRRDDSFRLAEDEASADIVLRVTNYRTSRVMHPKLERLILDGRVTIVERSEVVEVHYVDAVAIAGEARESLTGLDERSRGASLRNAASHLVDELERFCEEHCR